MWDSLYSRKHYATTTDSRCLTRPYTRAGPGPCACRSGCTHRPPAIFHGILLPSAHATPCAHDRMHDVGETRAFIYLLFICQRARYRSGPRTHDPAGDRFEKLLIVLFWKGVSRPPSWQTRSSFYASWLTRRRRPRRRRIGCARAYVPPFDRLQEDPSRRCESMGGDRIQKVKTESTLLRNQGG